MTTLLPLPPYKEILGIVTLTEREKKIIQKKKRARRLLLMTRSPVRAKVPRKEDSDKICNRVPRWKALFLLLRFIYFFNCIALYMILAQKEIFYSG